MNRHTQQQNNKIRDIMIVEEYKNGATKSYLADKYNLHWVTINRIIKGSEVKK